MAKSHRSSRLWIAGACVVFIVAAGFYDQLCKKRQQVEASRNHLCADTLVSLPYQPDGFAAWNISVADRDFLAECIREGRLSAADVDRRAAELSLKPPPCNLDALSLARNTC